MDEQFEIHINHVTKGEFTQSCTEMIRGAIVPIVALVAIVTLIITLATGDYSLRALVSPFIAVALMLVIGWLILRHGYKNFPKDTAFSYLIDSDGWQLSIGEDYANVDWRDTAKLVERSQIILLYNENNRSNLIPRRCLTEEQLAWMKTWFQDSRKAYREAQKEKTARLRRDHNSKLTQDRHNHKKF